MSLLPATSHANPTTPFWASASGGGGGPVIVRPGQTGSTSGGFLPFGDSYTMFYIDIPTEIAVGDDFIFQCVMNLEDSDSEVSPWTGNYSYVAVYNDDDKTWGVSGSTSAFNDGTGYSSTPDVTLTLVGHRGTNATPINILFINKIISTGFAVLNGNISGITFTKIGTGLVYTPPP